MSTPNEMRDFVKLWSRMGRNGTTFGDALQLLRMAADCIEVLAKERDTAVATLGRRVQERDKAREELKASCLWPACETTCSVFARYRKCSILAALADEPEESKGDTMTDFKESATKSYGVFIRTVIAIKQIVLELKQERFTARDIYGLGKQSAIQDDRESLWTPEKIEVLMHQLAESHDTVKFDNELFSCGSETYRVIRTPSDEEEWLRKMADAEDEAGGFPTETGVIVHRLKTIEAENRSVVYRGMPSDPEHALLHCLEVADKYTRLNERGGIAIIAIHEAQKYANKLIEHIMQLDTDLEGYHHTNRDLEAKLATLTERAEKAETTLAEINQIVEDAMAEEENPPFEIGALVFCNFSEARGIHGVVIDHCRDIDGEKVNVRLDDGTETGFCPVTMFAKSDKEKP